jgi:hypothetical protein
VAKSCPPYSGSIDYYADGNNWICHIPVPNYRYVGYGDFDPNGNFYFNGTTGSGRVVVSQIARGTECNVPAKYTALTTGNTIQSVGNVRFGTYGLSLLDPKAKVIYNYGLPKNGALGTPKSVTSLGGSGTIASAGFTYTLSRTSIFTTDSSSATANRYLMPLGGNPKETISVGGVPSGIAVGSESR